MATNIEVELECVRLSFAHVFKAQKGKNPDDKAKFNCSFLLDPSTKIGKRNIAKMEAAIEEAKEAKWGDNPPKLKSNKLCLRDGNDESWEGYEDMMYVSASNSRRPTCVDRRGKPTTEEDGLLYSGCYVNGIVRVWAQDNEHGKRVNASLEGVQFVKHGDAFGVAPLSADRFSDLGDDEDDEDDRPAKKSKRARDDDEDEDDRPAKKKAKKTRHDDDEDEDDRPSKKSKASKKSRYDDDEDEDEDV